jgi:hypothetical protein
MNLHMDPTTALKIARQHQADVRAAFPRRLPRPFLYPRPKKTYGGVTAVPALPDVAVPQPREPERDTTAA